MGTEPMADTTDRKTTDRSTPERNQQIVARYRSGVTLQEMGLLRPELRTHQSDRGARGRSPAHRPTSGRQPQGDDGRGGGMAS